MLQVAPKKTLKKSCYELLGVCKAFLVEKMVLLYLQLALAASYRVAKSGQSHCVHQ